MLSMPCRQPAVQHPQAVTGTANAAALICSETKPSSLAGVGCADMHACRQSSGTGASRAATQAAGSVFQGLLGAALKDAAAGAFEDEEDNEGTGGQHANCFPLQHSN